MNGCSWESVKVFETENVSTCQEIYTQIYFGTSEFYGKYYQGSAETYQVDKNSIQRISTSHFATIELPEIYPGVPEMYWFTSLWLNTLRPRQNRSHFADDTFKRIFFNENVRILINISLKFVPKGLINDIPALVQIMAWWRPGDKPLSEPMMVNLLMHILQLLFCYEFENYTFKIKATSPRGNEFIAYIHGLM